MNPFLQQVVFLGGALFLLAALVWCKLIDADWRASQARMDRMMRDRETWRGK